VHIGTRVRASRSPGEGIAPQGRALCARQAWPRCCWASDESVEGTITGVYGMVGILVVAGIIAVLRKRVSYRRKQDGDRRRLLERSEEHL
jgi:hypothetical protein